MTKQGNLLVASEALEIAYNESSPELPARRIQNNTHQNPTDQTRNGQHKDPTAVDPRDHAPVAVTEAPAHNGAYDALRRGHGGASGVSLR